MNKILYADAAGRQFQNIYTKSHYALAGLLPLGLISPTDSAPAKLCDLGLAVAIPVHSHIAMNFGARAMRLGPGRAQRGGRRPARWAQGPARLMAQSLHTDCTALPAPPLQWWPTTFPVRSKCPRGPACWACR